MESHTKIENYWFCGEDIAYAPPVQSRIEF